MRTSSLASLFALSLAGTLAAAAVPACGSSSSDNPGGDKDASASSSGGSSGGGIRFPPPDSGTGACTGLQCQVHSCGSGSTTISGTVYDPAGHNPLYGVVVYVPNKPPSALSGGASCDSCASLFTGDPITATVTDSAGKFTLQNVPDGTKIPLVVQVGKWRKQLVVPSVASCADTALPDKTVTLPKNHAEGDIPQIAISTGGADTLECLLKRVGVDEAEYGSGPSGAGHIHIYRGADAQNGDTAADTSAGAPSSPTSLWANKASLMKYDLVLLSCEGQETTSPVPQALHDYASAGGRVFASHFHYAFFNVPPYANENLADWVPQSNIHASMSGTITQTLPNGQSFPEGKALHDWLGNVGALTNDKLPIEGARHDANVTAANTPSQSWIQSDSTSGAECASGQTCATMYFPFNTPTDAPMGDAGERSYCGRVVYSDLHVGGASGDYNGGTRVVPTGCSAGALSAQEKALEFMLFDLSSCVTPVTGSPQPPSIIK